MDKGTLYIVSGPIGNLSDITYRAIKTLAEVDLVLSEDTRETEKLLKHYEISVPQISYRDQNHERIFSSILDLLNSGKSAALVSDSGTPLISDPGFKLVRELLNKGIKVTTVPGPSAVVAALSISGLPTDKFTFVGFLPKKENQRKEILRIYGSLETTLVIYESPFRVRKLLEEIEEVLGNRTVFIAKDLTKMYENVINAKIQDLLSDPSLIKEKGEFVVLIAKEGY
jgi:16S rRNA (cytidine1402-2'-O)-methyltransferase